MDILIAFVCGIVAGAAACFYVLKKNEGPTAKIKSGPPPTPPR